MHLILAPIVFMFIVFINLSSHIWLKMEPDAIAHEPLMKIG